MRDIGTALHATSRYTAGDHSNEWWLHRTTITLTLIVHLRLDLVVFLRGSPGVSDFHTQMLSSNKI